MPRWKVPLHIEFYGSDLSTLGAESGVPDWPEAAATRRQLAR